MGSISPYTLFHRRNDRHDSGRIFLRSAFFQLNVVLVVVFRFRAVLSRSGDLSFLYSAGENQMDRLGVSSVLIVRLCCEHEFLSHGTGSCPGQLSDLFWTRNYSRCPPSRRSLSAKKTLRAEFSKRSRAAS